MNTSDAVFARHMLAYEYMKRNENNFTYHDIEDIFQISAGTVAELKKHIKERTIPIKKNEEEERKLLKITSMKLRILHFLAVHWDVGSLPNN